MAVTASIQGKHKETGKKAAGTGPKMKRRCMLGSIRSTAQISLGGSAWWRGEVRPQEMRCSVRFWEPTGLTPQIGVGADSCGWPSESRLNWRKYLMPERRGLQSAVLGVSAGAGWPNALNRFSTVSPGGLTGVRSASMFATAGLAASRNSGKCVAPVLWPGIDRDMPKHSLRVAVRGMKIFCKTEQHQQAAAAAPPNDHEALRCGRVSGEAHNAERVGVTSPVLSCWGLTKA